MVEINPNLQAIEDLKVVKKIMASVGGDTEGEKSLRALIKSIGLSKCTFCEGCGHNARQCGFKRNIDRAVQNAPQLKKLWGCYKGQNIRHGKTVVLKRKALADIAKLEVEFKK